MKQGLAKREPVNKVDAYRATRPAHNAPPDYKGKAAAPVTRLSLLDIPRSGSGKPFHTELIAERVCVEPWHAPDAERARLAASRR